MNLHRPSDLLSVDCQAATCSLASVSSSALLLAFLCGESDERREFAVLGGGGLGLLVSMVISLCVCVLGGGREIMGLKS